MVNQAYVTLLYNDDYLPGAITLAHALKEVGTTKDLVVLITPAVSPHASAQLVSGGFSRIIEVSPLTTPAANDKEFLTLKRPELDLSFTKIRLWQALDGLYESAVFLDADCLPIKPIDDLFSIDLEDSEIAAAPDSGWPDIFNSGVFVTKPSLTTFDKLFAVIARGGPGEISFDGGDQGLLNQHLKWKRIPFTFNTTPSASYQYLPAYNFFKDDVKVVHFAGHTKPWKSQAFSGGVDDLVSQWNDVFSRSSLGRAVPAQPSLIAAPIDKWDATKFKPPLESAAEAADLPSEAYSFENRAGAFHYPEFGEETVKLPFEGKTKPERVFYNAI